MAHVAFRLRAGRPILALLAASSLSAGAANFDVATDAQLRSAIVAAGNGDTITFTADITLAADLPTPQASITFVGNGRTLSGNNQFRGLFIGAFTGSSQTAVNITVQDLTITNARAQGGTGGGGGAGLGGAIFVASNATLTVSNVTLTGNSAVAGAGSPPVGPNGGGGMGGDGGFGAGPGGGGGLGAGSTGGNDLAAGSAGVATGGSSGGT